MNDDQMNNDQDNELMKRIVLCLVAFTMVTTLAFCAPDVQLSPATVLVSK